MLKLDNLYSFMEGNFDYLLVVDENEKVIHASRMLIEDCFSEDMSIEGAHLADVLESSSLSTFRSTADQVRSGGRAIVVFTPAHNDDVAIPLKAGHADRDGGFIGIYFGNRYDSFSKLSEREKDERIKELVCLYSVAEFIKTSSSIDEFFTELPRIISPGMLYPEKAVVYSVYQGKEYGEPPSHDNYISVGIVFGGQKKGEIRVGYLDKSYELLPEEKKMLDEIGRMLDLALERKELRERVEMMEEEEADYNKRIEGLKKEISARTQELEEQKNKLNVVDTYLDRVKGDWEESRTRLETMFKAIPDDVVLIDKNRKVVMTNREHVEPGDYCYKVFFNRERPCENCRLARILKDKTPVSLMMKQEDKYLQVHALPVYNQDHEVDGILEFYRDVTLEKTYEQQLQQADKLASLGQLVSGIGHEINNPNQFIRGNIKIIKQSLEDMLPIVDEYFKSNPDLKIARLNYDFFRQHIMMLVDDMNHGSERIKGIVESLRTFVRKDEGLLVDTIDINTLIEASTRLVHNQVHKRAEIVLDLADDIPTFAGNSQKIEQVLVNLMVNASEAMPDERKGTITVKTRFIGKEVLVEVEDNGMGMNQKTMKQIFDPFFTTKRAKGGTGLGLAIAYKIIEEHGGNISVASEAGSGTKFTIKIPARSSPVKSAKVQE